MASRGASAVGGLIACLVCFGLASEAFAAEMLTWDDCVQESNQHNPDLLAAQAVVREARAKYLGSYTAFLPQVSADVGVDRSGTKTASSSSTVMSNSVGLSASETLFSGFGNEATVQQQHAGLQAAEAAFAQTKAQVGFDLKSAFAQLLFAQEQVALAEGIAARRQENVRLVDLRYQGGREHQGSFLRSQAAAQQAVFDVAQAKRALQVAQQQLAKVLGRRDAAELSIGGELKPAAVSEPPDFSSLMAQTPAHRQADAQARGARAGVTVARSGFYPTVSAGGSLSRVGADWPPGDDKWLAGITVSLPFFSRGQTFFNVQSANAERDRTQAALKSTDDQTVFTLKQAFAAYQDAVGKVSVQEEFLHAAQVREEIARSQYTTGLLSFQDWDLIEDDLITNQKAMLTSRRDAVTAEATWERTQGNGALP